MDTKVTFALDGGNPTAAARLQYRPWGTRTLKVVVSTASTLPALRLRPRRILAADRTAGVIRGFAEGSEALVVSWGGGHEPGPCVQAEDFLKAFEKCAPLAPGATSTIFFNVSHVGPELPASAMLVLEAYDEASGQVHAALPVELVAPPGLPADVIRLLPSGPGAWAPSAGAHLAAYDSRWWPDGEVAYVPAAPPPLTIERAGNTLRVLWAGAPLPVATIVDHTQPTVLDLDGAVAFELFGFAGGLVALRAWFFWLDTRVGPDFFVGRHEVPDVERFDLVIRPSDGRVILACSDAHWREVWGEVPEPPAPALEMTLGMSPEARLKLLQLALGFGDDHGSADTPVGSYSPRAFIEAAAARRAAPSALSNDEVPREKGTEAHLPSLVNVQQPDPGHMISSDVRLG
jgi:hypothetical protein